MKFKKTACDFLVAGGFAFPAWIRAICRVGDGQVCVWSNPVSVTVPA